MSARRGQIVVSATQGWYAAFDVDEDLPAFERVEAWLLDRDSFEFQPEQVGVALITEREGGGLEVAASNDNFVAIVHEEELAKDVRELLPRGRLTRTELKKWLKEHRAHVKRKNDYREYAASLQ